ncbi:PTS lactose transporter subunit IIB [Brachybacterium sp. p3-SID1565]|uniref:PTS lactose transporter subunit IIB n=2 Tax=Bacteria TaxID=2 RepID=A0ABR9VZZ5_9MICO|nr:MULTISPECIES: PTS lactose transporter subunit IIB [Brachybacterium]MBE9403734.1 PTS lactose transporter subunit IIB [Brachybacterium epidermidis]MCT1384793.1 PTS lactose transporter subunit IIB [Brachybacterium sp. p3-SID1565]
MLTIAIVCGAGIATSALLAKRVREHVAPRGAHLRVVQATVMDLLSPDFTADLVVSTVDLPDALGIPRVSGMPLLLGTRPEQTYQDIDTLLDRIDTAGTDGTDPGRPGDPA